MTYAEAKHMLLVHGSEITDAAGKPLVLDDGLLGSLRPWRGLVDRNFHSILQALFVVGQHRADSPQVDRRARRHLKLC